MAAGAVQHGLNPACPGIRADLNLGNRSFAGPRQPANKSPAAMQDGIVLWVCDDGFHLNPRQGTLLNASAWSSPQFEVSVINGRQWSLSHHDAFHPLHGIHPDR